MSTEVSTSATLAALINAKRPFKGFTVEGIVDEETGNPVQFYARKPGSGEQGEFDTLFNQAYKSERDRIESDSSEMAIFRRNLARQNEKDLIDYIIDSDEADFEFEALKMIDAPTDAEGLQKIVKRLKETRREEMKATFTKDDLIVECIERRTHQQAWQSAQAATLKNYLSFTIYDKNKERLFADVDAMREVPESTLLELYRACADALKEQEVAKKDDPLEQAASKPSEEPSSSHGTRTVATKRSRGRSTPTPIS